MDKKITHGVYTLDWSLSKVFLVVHVFKFLYKLVHRRAALWKLVEER